MTRFDLISPREDRSGKTRWHKVGAAFPRDNGGFSLVFDALPLPDKDGNVRLLMTEAKPRDDRGAPAGYAQAPNNSANTRSELDDEIPW
jgi:hypothetical protein